MVNDPTLNKQGVRNLNGSKLTGATPRPEPAVPTGALDRMTAALAREDIMEWFSYEHLPPGIMRETSAMWAALAESTHANLPRCAERSVALRKLLEGKDAAVRAAKKARDAKPMPTARGDR